MIFKLWRINGGARCLMRYGMDRELRVNCVRVQAAGPMYLMQHLAVLEGAGLAIAKREGRVRWNYLNVVLVQEIYDRWISRNARPSVKLLGAIEAGIGVKGKAGPRWPGFG